MNERVKARKWIRRAVLREKENANFRATYAAALWYGLQRPNSYKQARRAIELDANNVEGLYWAGRFMVWSWEMNYFTENENEVHPTSGGRTVGGGKTFRHFQYGDLDIGLRFLNLEIQLDPDHWASHQVLGSA